MRTNNTHIVHLNMLLDNPYARYMSKCIGCPLNPFNKKQSGVVSEEQMKKELVEENNPAEPKEIIAEDIYQSSQTELIDTQTELIDAQTDAEAESVLKELIQNELIQNELIQNESAEDKTAN
jgi:hypothetical protein